MDVRKESFICDRMVILCYMHIKCFPLYSGTSLIAYAIDFCQNSVGNLMYAQVCTHPDIAFAVNALGTYLSNPGLNHWKAVKKVMRYLQGTKDYMLTHKRSDQLKVIGYSDFGLQGPTISLVSGF